MNEKQYKLIIKENKMFVENDGKLIELDEFKKVFRSNYVTLLNKEICNSFNVSSIYYDENDNEYRFDFEQFVHLPIHFRGNLEISDDFMQLGVGVFIEYLNAEEWLWTHSIKINESHLEAFQTLVRYFRNYLKDLFGSI